MAGSVISVVNMDNVSPMQTPALLAAKISCATSRSTGNFVISKQ